MILTTGTLREHRRLEDAGYTVIDITVKSAKGDYRVFAPTWDMVMGHKRRTISTAKYTERYLGMMRESYRQHTNVWHKVARMDAVALVCYCMPDRFCHRHLLADYIEAVCSHLGIKCRRAWEKRRWID